MPMMGTTTNDATVASCELGVLVSRILCVAIGG